MILVLVIYDFYCTYIFSEEKLIKGLFQSTAKSVIINGIVALSFSFFWTKGENLFLKQPIYAIKTKLFQKWTLLVRVIGKFCRNLYWKGLLEFINFYYKVKKMVNSCVEYVHVVARDAVIFDSCNLHKVSETGKQPDRLIFLKGEKWVLRADILVFCREISRFRDTDSNADIP